MIRWRPKLLTTDQFHYQTGKFVFNLTKELDREYFDRLPTSNSPSKGITIIAIHAILLSAGFLLFLPFGSLVARYTRSYTVKWFSVHKICNLYVAGPIIVLGWILGPIAVANRESEHFLDKHQVSNSLDRLVLC